MENIKFSKEGLMELIVRDFAERYLGLKGSFELRDIVNVPIEKFPTDFNDESYTIGDIKYCMNYLGLIDYALMPWYENDTPNNGSKILFHVSISDEISVDYSLFDLLYNTSNSGVSFKKCKRCGKLFIANKEIDYCHYTNEENPISCYQMFLNENAKNDINYLIESFAYNSNRLRRFRIAKEEYEKWISKATSKIQNFIALKGKDHNEADMESIRNIISWMSKSVDKIIERI